ncbi:MAG: EAL domain-containing protein [Proteobacteria bacterium]|nr:EAL domain-containing protein [Pseudomonadota bacterium]
MGAPDFVSPLLRGTKAPTNLGPHDRSNTRPGDSFPRAQVRWALQERRLRVVYQPIACLEDQRVVGHEALARMLTPQGRVLTAEHFIDAAASIGLEPRIDAEITAQVMQAACRPGPFAVSHGKLFLNCSSTFLTQPASVEQLMNQHQGWCKAWPGAAMAATPWVLEITERNLVTDPHHLLESIQPLLNLGFELALDDFGSNHSAFPYILALPIRYLKLDKTLVQASANRRAMRVLRGLQEMARDFGMITIAEGVESRALYERLRDISIDWGQGYLWDETARMADGAPLSN